MVTSENAHPAEAEAITAKSVYQQAREQAGADTGDYDVQSGLDRLSAWMQGGREAGPGLHAVPSDPAANRRRKRVRTYPLPVDDLAVDEEDVGYRSATACAAAGITPRQLDYWARTGLVEPSVRAAHGSGSRRLYGFRDILILKTVRRLLDTGLPLQQIRAAVQHLRDHGTADLAQVTLMSDGVSIYECKSPDEIVDLLASGQGIFGIALGRVWQEVARELAALPGAPRQRDLAEDRRDGTNSYHSSGNGTA